MNKQEIKVIEGLLASETFKGKKMLSYLLWLNTVEPKHKAGDCFMITKRGEQVYGYPVKNLKAKVIKSYSYKETCTYYYQFEAVVICNGKEHITTHYLSESEIYDAYKCDNNINDLGTPKSDSIQSCDIYI